MYDFFALLNRMKYINRWGLMRNISPENIQEHSHQTAVFAHALCVIAIERYGEALNPERACLLAVYHDAPEIFTGDMPTPVKYYNDDIKNAYKLIEQTASQKLLSLLPDYMKDRFSFIESYEKEPEWKYVKAADTLSAYVKCLDESSAGNREFSAAEKAVKAKLNCLAADLPALQLFIKEFLPPFGFTLDQTGI